MIVFSICSFFTETEFFLYIGVNLWNFCDYYFIIYMYGIFMQNQMRITYHIRVTGPDGWHKFSCKKIFDLGLTKKH